MHRITIVALGADALDLTDRIKKVLSGPAPVVMRTARCGAAQWMQRQKLSYRALDALYDQAEDFDQLHDMLAAEVLRMAEKQDVVYGVLDLRDGSVERLIDGGGAHVTMVPGVSLEGALGARAAGPADLVAACDIARYQPSSDQAALVREIDSRVMASDVKLRLMERYPEEAPMLLYDGREIRQIPLCELDRQPRYDHQTCAAIPAVVRLTDLKRFGFDQLNQIVRRLRAPDGCPWDRKQTHRSLRANVIEEAYEVADAIDSGDAAGLYDELGDLLLQVSLHAEIARQHGDFEIDDVTSAICHKLIARHPHIFGEKRADTPEEVQALWRQVKKEEKRLSTQAEGMDAVTRALPALMRAQKVQEKAADVGFDWQSALEALPKVLEEAAEAADAIARGEGVAEELGDLLFAVVNVARLAKVEPELALAAATDKFAARFAAMERAILADGLRLEGMSLEEMDGYWDRIKQSL